MGTQKLDRWTKEMLMAIAMADADRIKVALAMGANRGVGVTPGFLELLRERQVQWLSESWHDAGRVLTEVRRCMK